MIKVIGVRFRKAGKVYFFDPAGMEIKTGDHVIVETARGIEFGHVVLGNREVDEKKVVQPLKPVIRMANKNDEEIEKKNKEKEKEAFKICLEKIKKHDLQMKLILAGSDPCDLAVNYGRSWAAVSNLMPRLESWFVIRKKNIEVECDFTASETLVYSYLDLTITLGRLLSLVVVY